MLRLLALRELQTPCVRTRTFSPRVAEGIQVYYVAEGIQVYYVAEGIQVYYVAEGIQVYYVAEGIQVYYVAEGIQVYSVAGGIQVYSVVGGIQVYSETNYSTCFFLLHLQLSKIYKGAEFGFNIPFNLLLVI